MYQVDDRDRVIELTDLPQSSVGAPIPVVVGDEYSVAVAYYLQETPEGWDGTTIRAVGPTDADELLVIVHFKRSSAYFSGPPNDEAFDGHPLAGRGLEPYGVFEVLDSSWIRAMERMNSVHPNHSPALFSDLRHIILTFHDSVFECAAREFDIHLSRGSASDAVDTMARFVFARES